MLRIVAHDERPTGLRLRLMGRLAGPWVGELRRACEGAGRPGRPLTLDLADVTFVDHAGADLLEELARGGAALANGSAFVRERLRAVKSDQHATSVGREEHR